MKRLNTFDFWQKQFIQIVFFIRFQDLSNKVSRCLFPIQLWRVEVHPLGGLVVQTSNIRLPNKTCRCVSENFSNNHGLWNIRSKKENSVYMDVILDSRFRWDRCTEYVLRLFCSVEYSLKILKRQVGQRILISTIFLRQCTIYSVFRYYLWGSFIFTFIA